MARSLVVFLPLLLLGPSCRKENNVDQSKKTTNNAYVQVGGDDGGFAGARSGPGVNLPPFASEEKVSVSVRTAEPTEYSNLPFGAAGDVYAFDPVGTVFDLEVDVFLPQPQGVSAFQIYAAADGASWQALPDKVDLVSQSHAVHFKTMALSYFVVVDAAAGKPMGTAGAASSAGGASTGSGPNCKPDGTAPSAALVDVNAELLGNDGSKTPIALAGTDGFAVVAKQDNGTPMLSLVFSDYAQACGSALMTGSTPPLAASKPTGNSSGSVVSMLLMLDPLTGPKPGTYNVAELNYASFDVRCVGDLAPQPRAGTVEVTDITADHVAGNITIDIAPTKVTGSFDVPICNLPDKFAQVCCAL